MKLNRRRNKKKPGLMLTSLLDMFTIILIFLIVSFDSENQEFELNTELSVEENIAAGAADMVEANDRLEMEYWDCC